MSLVNGNREEKVRDLFGEFDCGCDNRREIMSAAPWRQDLAVIAAMVVAVAVVLVVVKAQ